MFSVFGSPLQEDFTDTGSSTLRGCKDLGNGSVSCSNSMIRKIAASISSESETSDSEIDEAKREEEISNKNSGFDSSSGKERRRRRVW